MTKVRKVLLMALCVALVMISCTVVSVAAVEAQYNPDPGPASEVTLIPPQSMFKGQDTGAKELPRTGFKPQPLVYLGFILVIGGLIMLRHNKKAARSKIG